MSSKQFYSFPTNKGTNQFVNINNIASIESHHQGCLVTLNVRGEDNNFICFIATLPWGHVTGHIIHMDNNQSE